MEVYKFKNHIYRMIDCIAKKVKIYIYIIFKYINSENNYQTIAFRYSAREKT